jgi:branched-subunit amino acid ABC-type transport system permease component
MNEAIQVIIGGLTLSAVYFLLGSGVSLVFGQSRIVNFAHGQFLVIAGFAGWAIERAGVPVIFALIFAILTVALVAFILERLLLKRVADSPFTAFLVTLGVFLVLQQAVISIWGPAPEQLVTPLGGSWQIGQVNIPKTSPVIFSVALIVGVGIVLLMRKTGLGRAIRASAEDSFAGEYCGININRISSLTFAAGSAVAGLGGVLVALVYPIDPMAGNIYLMTGFVVALIGGLGSIEGAAVGALILGLSSTAGQAYGAAIWVPAITTGLIIVVLLFRPNGLFSRFGGAISEAVAVNRMRRSGPSYKSRQRTLTGLVVLLLVAVPFIGVNYSGLNVIQVAVVFAIVATSVGFFYRMTGILNFGSGAFMGIGGYVVAIGVNIWGWNFWQAFIVSLLVCGFVGAIVGLVLSRARGLYFVIITFSVCDLFALVEQNWAHLTGGSAGITVISNFGSVFGINFSSPRSLYYLFVAGLLIVTVFTGWILKTGYGRRSQSVRENERLAMSLGVSPRWYIVSSFAISCMVAGLGGIFFVYQDLAIAPAQFTGIATVTFPLMVILGGGLEGGGPVIGAALLTVMPHYLNFSPATKIYVYGALIIVIMLSFRDGIIPSVNQFVDGAISRFKRTPALGATAAGRVNAPMGGASGDQRLN